MIYLYIAVGGAAGALARFGLTGWISPGGAAFPWGTFLVNVLGSFVLGFSVRLMDGYVVDPEIRTMITVGILGAFTTFSTFTFEAVALAQRGDWMRAAGYLGGSVAFGIAGILAGLALGSVAMKGG